MQQPATSPHNPASILFTENPLLVQLIGLSPLLAVSYTLVNSLAMAIIFSAVFLSTSIIASASRHLIPITIALPCYVIISATVVTCIDFLLQASRPELREALWIYLPIVAANCLIIDRLHTVAAQHTLGATIINALMHCLVVTLVLVLLGTCRELIGTGTLFQDTHLLFGYEGKIISGAAPAEPLAVRSEQAVSRPVEFALAKLPAGAFICLGLLIALKQFIFPQK